eukprot:g53899.t1
MWKILYFEMTSCRDVLIRRTDRMGRVRIPCSLTPRVAGGHGRLLTRINHPNTKWIHDHSLQGSIMGVDLSGTRKTRVICIETGEIFESISAAARQLGVSRFGLFKALNGTQDGAYGKCGGYTWRNYE